MLHSVRSTIAQKTLIYLHIPKCGGSTLSTILRANFPSSRTYFVSPTNIASSRSELASMPVEQRRELDLVYGHLSYGWHTLLPRTAAYFTILRHPVDRVVSHYNYVKYRKDHPHYLREIVENENMTIRDYVTSGICDEVNNGHVRLLAGVEDIVQQPYGNSRIPYGTNDRALLEQALCNIDEHFLLVGLQERFDETLLLMKKRLRLRRLNYRSRNVANAHYHKQLPSPAEVAIIEEYNQLDLELYERMYRRFEGEFANLLRVHLQLAWFRFNNRFRA